MEEDGKEGADDIPVHTTFDTSVQEVTSLEEHETEMLDDAYKEKTTAPSETIAITTSNDSEICNAVDSGVVLLTKLDKAVCTNDTLEDLQRAITYEAIFATLFEKKVLAMKRDCEERKRAKRMKRKSIGRIFFGKKLFGGSSGSRKSSICKIEDESPVKDALEVEQLSPTAISTVVRSRSTDDIEVASPSVLSQRTRTSRSKLKTVTASADAQPNADDSVTSTLSNSTDKNSTAEQIVKRSLLVHAQTHTPAEIALSSSSGDSKAVPHAINLSTGHSIGNENGISAVPISLIERTYDTVSLASGYENGTGARVHTSTMAEDSLTSLRDSIESLSFASSRCTVSFGATEIIPEDSESLLYERARIAKRLRILEAKSISAQCSPILPRHPMKIIPAPMSPLTRVPTAAVQTGMPVPSTIVSITTADSAAVTLAPNATALIPSTTTRQTQTKSRFLPNQLSYTDSMYGCATNMDAANARYFSRQNTSEDSANVTLSTLLNQSDSLSLHAAPISSPSTAVSGVGASGAIISKPFSIDNRYKSKSTSLLTTTHNGRYSSNRPMLPALLQPLPNSIHSTIAARKLEQLHITSNMNYSDRQVDSLDIKFNQPPSNILALNGHPTSSFATPTALLNINTDSSSYTALRNGVLTNGAIVPSTTLPGDTAKLNRMTSTSTGSSVAPTGCCTTTKSTKEKQHFKPSWPSGQSGSDDEYRRRKRKYKRYHRCSDPILVYPTPSGLQHCILSMPTNEPVNFPYTEDFAYDMQLQLESDKNDDLEEIVPSSHRRHRRHRHHRHKKRHRHKKPKILVQDLETQVVKVIDPHDLSQRARWTIIATACLLLLMCLMLVGITLRMAPIIDDMVRQENERMMKEAMDRARFGKNYTDTSSIITSPGLSITHHQQIP